MAEKTKKRLGYIDWMRGFACLMMFQTHCFDSWLGGPARDTAFFRWSQLGGTLPAPLFLFLAGVSFSLVTDKGQERGLAGGQIGRAGIRRGVEIFGLGLLFRVQEFILGQPGAPWTDLLRVDILNTIGISLMLLGLGVWAAAGIAQLKLLVSPAGQPGLAGGLLGRLRWATIAAAVAAAAAIAMATPPLWTTARPHWLPWFLESYVNGVHTYAEPQPWLFPIFPWAAFAFAGLAIGLLIRLSWARRHEAGSVALVGLGGIGVATLGYSLDTTRFRLYAVYDFWHTSPNFFLIRAGVMMLIVLGSYAWCRWGAGEWGFSPLIQLGRTSLLVYWVHIEFVYGRFSILPKRQMGIPAAALGLLTIFSAMVLLSLARTRLKGRGAVIWAGLRRLVRAGMGDKRDAATADPRDV